MYYRIIAHAPGNTEPAGVIDFQTKAAAMPVFAALCKCCMDERENIYFLEFYEMHEKHADTVCTFSGPCKCYPDE